jgi:hypothetical protein
LVARRLQTICDYLGLPLLAGFAGGFGEEAGVSTSPSTSNGTRPCNIAFNFAVSPVTTDATVVFLKSLLATR